jgi:hypothetical protein
MSRPLLFVALSVLALGVMPAGCGGGSSSEVAPAQPTPPPAPPSPPPPSTSDLIERARTFPPMPKEIAELLSISPSATGTFGSGLPFNDLEYTIYDTDYMEGETHGYDTFMPVDPADAFPGAGRINIIRTVNNVDLDAGYSGARGDRIILGVDEIAQPFFVFPEDDVDADYAVISNFDYENGAIQLRGAPDDYALVFCDAITDGCQTSGYYLFHVAAGAPDLIAFIFQCDDLAATISGVPPANPAALCNASRALSLEDPGQFLFAAPIETQPALDAGFQFGGPGKEIVGGFTLDAAGNVYAFGMSDSNLDGGEDAPNEVFIARYTPSGEALWITELALPDGSLIWDAAADDTHLYAAGRTLGALEGFENAGRWDGILLKLRLDTGEIVATDQFGNEGLDGYGQIVLDDAGHLFVSAQGSRPGEAGTDPYHLVAKHRRSDLSVIWRRIEAPETGPEPVIVSEAWGGLSYVQGASPGDGELVAAGWYFTGTGANAWIEILGALNTDAPERRHAAIVASNGVEADWILDNAVAADGSIYAVGFTTGGLDGTQIGQGDAFVVRYDEDLSNAVFRQIGTRSADAFRNIEISADGRIFALGYTYGDFDGLQNANADNTTGDVLIVELSAELDVLGSYQFGTRGEDRGYLRISGDDLAVAGMTEMALAGDNLGAFDGYFLPVPIGEFFP